MIKQSLTFKRGGLRAVKQRIQNAPTAVIKEHRAIMRRVGEQAKAELRVQPGRPKYPIQWQSERQRRAFFASKGFGRGIPTRRTGALGKGWSFEYGLNTRGQFRFGTGVILRLVNKLPYAKYVQGNQQQKMHKNTRWRTARSVAIKYNRIARETLIALWKRQGRT